MGKKRNRKKQVKAILGHGPYGSIVLDEPIALYTTEEGKRRSSAYMVFPDGTVRRVKQCREADVLTVSAITTTRSDGTRELLLSDFHCEGISVQDPVTLIATARASSPVFVTAVPEVIDGGNDVRMNFNTWRAGGEPAANVHVSWHCRVQMDRGDPIIN